MTAAVALLMPPVIAKNSPDKTSATETTHVETSHTAADRTSNKPASISTQNTSKDMKSYAAAADLARVTDVPTSKDNDKVDGIRQLDYSKYALVPSATSRLPFRLATGHTTTPPSLPAQSDDKNRKRSDPVGTVYESGRERSVNHDIAARFHTSADRLDTVSTGRPQFSGIQQIIRQLESSCANSAVVRPVDSSVGARPKHQRPPDSGFVDPRQKPEPTVSRDDSVTSPALRNATTSPLDLMQVSEQTQTSPRSSVQATLQSADDKSLTVKSRSLESQQRQHQQQLNNPAVMPRSFAAVTTATHSVAIPLPPPPAASPTSTPADVDMTERESPRPEQPSSDNKRKRKHS